MASITSLGAGSGIFSSDLVDQLVQAERVPTETRLNQREQSVKAQISAFGAIRSALEALNSPLETLASPEGLEAYSANSSNEEVVGVSTASGGVSPGTFSLDVTSLAQRQSLASGSFADRDTTPVGTGTLTFTVGGNSTDVVIDGSNNTLGGMAEAINDAGAGVSASVVDTGSGFRLVLTSDESGLENSIEVSVSGDGDGNNTDSSGLSQFTFDGTSSNLTETVEARDAQLEVNGIAISRSSNSVEGVVEGVTFDLKSTGSSTVTVSTDADQVASRVQDFVDKFNSLQDVIKSTSGFDAASGQGGILSGDSTIRGLQSDLRRLLTSIPGDLQESPVRLLADIGVTTDPSTGKLDFDQEKFKAQLADNPGAVSTLFSAEDGVASSVSGSLERYLQFDGSLDNRTEGLNRALDEIQSQRDRLDQRIESYRERLISQFSAADSLISQIQSTGNFVNQQLAAIAPQSSNSNQ